MAGADPSLVIRPADPARDAAACAAIYAPYVTDTVITFELDPPGEAEFARRIATFSATYVWLVAEQDGSVAGYAYASPHRDRAAYASSCDVAVYCAKDRRGRGLGRALYGALLPQLSGRYHAAFAGITIPNPASIALHERFGFSAIGIYRQVGRKFGNWLDVGWWQKLL